MIRLRIISILFLTTLTLNLVNAQVIEFEGKLQAEGDVEGIHIINESLGTFATSNKEGKFTIEARVKDTIYVSSVRYEHKRFRVTDLQYQAQQLVINLTESVNQLDQVVIGTILTGDLASDLKNSEAKAPLNFWDVGLPGYKGKRLTQSERRLAHADAGPPIITPTSINVHRLLNKISGHTKRMKERVRVETETVLINAIRDDFGTAFFEVHNLEENKHPEFWFYCQEDKDFMMRCKQRSDLDVIVFLEEKLVAFKENLSKN